MSLFDYIPGFNELFKNQDPKMVSAPTLGPEQQAWVQQLMQGVSGQTIGPGGDLMSAPAYQGQRVAPLSGLQKQGIGMMGQNIPGMFGQGMGAWERMIDPAENMDYWNQAFVPMQEGLAGRFGALQGARSSGMGQAMGRSYAQNIIPQVMGQQQSALGMMPQMGNVPMQMMGAGALPRDVQQQQLGAQQALWGEQQPYSNPYAQMGFQATGTPTMEYGYMGGGPQFDKGK